MSSISWLIRHTLPTKNRLFFLNTNRLSYHRPSILLSLTTKEIEANQAMSQYQIKQEYQYWQEATSESAIYAFSTPK